MCQTLGEDLEVLLSVSSWFGHLFSIKVNLSQASYKDSLSRCLKFWISIFLSQYFDIGKYFSKNLSASSSHVWMVPLGMVSNQSLAFPVKVKGNNRNFFWLSVIVTGVHKTHMFQQNGSSVHVGSCFMSHHTVCPSTHSEWCSWCQKQQD